MNDARAVKLNARDAADCGAAQRTGIEGGSLGKTETVTLKGPVKREAGGDRAWLLVNAHGPVGRSRSEAIG